MQAASLDPPQYCDDENTVRSLPFCWTCGWIHKSRISSHRLVAARRRLLRVRTPRCLYQENDAYNSEVILGTTFPIITNKPTDSRSPYACAQPHHLRDLRQLWTAVYACERWWPHHGFGVNLSTLRLGFLNQQDSHNILRGGSPFSSFWAEIKCEMPRVCLSQILISRHPQNRQLKTTRNETVKNNK